MRNRVKIYSKEGRTREERENCFPQAKTSITRRQVRDDG